MATTRDFVMVKLMGEIARLLSPRQRTFPPEVAYDIAVRRLTSFAKVRDYPEAWVEEVILTFR